MRQVRRTTAKIPTLESDGLGACRAREHASDRADDPEAILSFSDYWNFPDVRGALYAMHGRRCAYCGCGLPRNDRGDVEHFRPKAGVKEDVLHGGYWWLAYGFDNYLLSCRPCNSARKRNYFPLRPRAVRATYATRTRLSREARVLLDPAVDPVDDWLRVDWRNSLCPIRPHVDLTGIKRKQVQATLDLFKINVDPDLVKERITLRDTVLNALNDGRVLHAAKLASRYSQHSLVAKHVLEDIAPDHLPTAANELEWLLKDLVQSLDLSLELAVKMPDEIQTRNVDELLWSLAVLWRDPPTGAYDSVEQFLSSAGILGRVRPMFDVL